MSEPKRPPRWTIAFLRALERAGDVRASAEDAGIDHTTAYARRRAHAEFASEWQEALAKHRSLVEQRQARELQSLEKLGATGKGSLSGAKIKRAGHDRWSERKEKLFFDELAATANVEGSAKAAGVSPQAVFARRLRDAHFRAKWAAVLATGRAAIEMHLVEHARKSFNPDEMKLGDAEPKVTVAEAIKIVQHGGRSPVAEYEPPPADQEDVDVARERLIQKLLRLKQRHDRERLAEGWSLDEASGAMIPPGWVRA